MEKTIMMSCREEEASEEETIDHWDRVIAILKLRELLKKVKTLLIEI